MPSEPKVEAKSMPPKFEVTDIQSLDELITLRDTVRQKANYLIGEAHRFAESALYLDRMIAERVGLDAIPIEPGAPVPAFRLDAEDVDR